MNVRRHPILLLVVLLSLFATGCASSPFRTVESSTPTLDLAEAEATGVPTATATGGVPAAAGSAELTDAPRLRNPLSPGNHRIELNHGRRVRSYIIHVPPSVKTPAPVVVALHGGGGNGPDFQAQNGLDAVADREGFFAVYPEGSGLLPNRLHTWNSGDSCCGFAMDLNIDDVGFLRAVLRSVATQVDADPGRVYMTGHSNGAMMAYRFAAEAADLVTAIVPVGGALDIQRPVPSQPVAVLHIHSLDDPRALYGGGLGPAFPGTERRINHEPVVSGIEQWASWNGCELAQETIERLSGSGADEGHTVERIAWPACDDGGAVEHLLLTGSGHGWPGITAPRLVQRHLGEPTTIIDASEEVWAFVSNFDR